MSPSRAEEADWATYVERRRRRSGRTVIDPASAVIARAAATAAAQPQPAPQSPNEQEPTE